MSQAIGLYAEPLPKYWPPPSRWPVRRRLPDNDVIRPLFEFILGNAPDSSGKPSPVLESAIETMMSAFICGPVIRPQIVPSAYPAAVQRVVNSILQRLVARSHTKVTLDDLAAIGGVSREHLCRLFRQYVGYSPVDMVYMYRLTRSLIGLNTGQTVEALAHEFGFADAPHYVRRFIALFGKSPAEMRQAMAKGYKPKLPKLPEMG